jgi:hypothetical protein
MASKIKVDQIQTGDGTGTIALQNQLSGMTDASLPSGKILQTVTANILGTTTTTSSSFGSTVVTATITPSSTSSKILIMMNGGMNGFAGGSGGQVGYTKIYRGTTALEASTKGSGVFYFDAPDVYVNLSVSIEDSPSTTSATTYTLYAKRASGNGTFSINRDGNCHMHVILMEIKG